MDLYRLKPPSHFRARAPLLRLTRISSLECILSLLWLSNIDTQKDQRKLQIVKYVQSFLSMFYMKYPLCANQHKLTMVVLEDFFHRGIKNLRKNLFITLFPLFFQSLFVFGWEVIFGKMFVCMVTHRTLHTFCTSTNWPRLIAGQYRIDNTMLVRSLSWSYWVGTLINTED